MFIEWHIDQLKFLITEKRPKPRFLSFIRREKPLRLAILSNDFRNRVPTMFSTEIIPMRT